MISEELTGKDLRAIAREYVSNLGNAEVLYNSRESALFEIIAPELKKSIEDLEKDMTKLSKKVVSI